MLGLILYVIIIRLVVTISPASAIVMIVHRYMYLHRDIPHTTVYNHDNYESIVYIYTRQTFLKAFLVFRYLFLRPLSQTTTYKT